MQSKKDDLIECCDEIMIFYMNHCDEDKDQERGGTFTIEGRTVGDLRGGR